MMWTNPQKRRNYAEVDHMAIRNFVSVVIEGIT